MILADDSCYTGASSQVAEVPGWLCLASSAGPGQGTGPGQRIALAGQLPRSAGLAGKALGQLGAMRPALTRFWTGVACWRDMPAVTA